MNENQQEKQADTPKVHQEQQAMQDEAKEAERREPNPRETPDQNRREHPQRQLS